MRVMIFLLLKITFNHPTCVFQDTLSFTPLISELRHKHSEELQWESQTTEIVMQRGFVRGCYPVPEDCGGLVGS